MKIAVLSDVHSNWHALEAVLESAAKDADEYICLGDVVGYGGDPVRCLEEVSGRGWPTLVGNHDRACTDHDILTWFNDDAATAIRWTVAQLTDAQLNWLRDRPESRETHGILTVHASPRDPIYEYILDPGIAQPNLEMLGDRICFHGHTHVPGYFFFYGGEVAHNYWLGAIRLEGPILVNPGSVGQPRDGIRDASYGLWDPEAGTFEFRRVPYDRRGAQKAIRDAGLPERFATRLDYGR